MWACTCSIEVSDRVCDGERGRVNVSICMIPPLPPCICRTPPCIYGRVNVSICRIRVRIREIARAN